MSSSSSNKSSQDSLCNVKCNEEISLQEFIRESELQETSLIEDYKINEDENSSENEINNHSPRRKNETFTDFSEEQISINLESENLFFEWNEEFEQISITTGSRALDKMLEGGIEVGSITELFGESGTGKTQFAHTLAVTCQLPIDAGGAQGKCLYIDTEGTFRPERLLTIAERFGMNSQEVLDNVHYVRVYNTDQQTKILKKARLLMAQTRFALVIVDCVTFLYRTDYTGVEEFSIGHRHLKRFLRQLQNLINEYNISVVVTNQVSTYSKDTKTIIKPIADSTIGHSSTTRLYLKSYLKETRICQLYSSPTLPESSVFYSIDSGGITDVKE